MKLRQHLKMLHENIGEIQHVTETSNTSEKEESDIQEIDSADDQPEPSTEQDLVGVTRVAYIQPDGEPEEDPENITLPPETELINKQACTISTGALKKETIEPSENEHDNDNMFVMDDSYMNTAENEAASDEVDYDAIAEAVKATLASQPGKCLMIKEIFAFI